jgi:hypothetical protein
MGFLVTYEAVMGALLGIGAGSIVALILFHFIKQ